MARAAYDEARGCRGPTAGAARQPSPLVAAARLTWFCTFLLPRTQTDDICVQNGSGAGRGEPVYR